MFGLLGGLLAGGLMRGMQSRMGGAGGATGGRAPMVSEAPVQAPSPMQQASPTPPQSTAPEPQQAAKPPQAQPLANTAPATLQQPAQQQSPLAGLMSDTTPAPAAPKPAVGQAGPPKQVVNPTSSLTPVSKQAAEQFGAAPVPPGTEMANQIIRPSPQPTRIKVDFMDMNPSKTHSAPNSYSPDLGHSMAPPPAGFNAPNIFRYTR